jgi:hypothetical protein
MLFLWYFYRIFFSKWAFRKKIVVSFCILDMNTPETYQSRYFDDTKNKSSSFFVLFAIYGLLGSYCLPKTRGLHMGVNHLNGAGLTVFFMDVRLMFECDICEDMELKIGLLAKKRKKNMY